ncbi:MAG: hypothetical protein JRH01_25775 [Deltaproteobacteria bacterium]|nr:hypothetical protein [Deltaproteobacteria bacterium]MBW2397318.1 hypothetical protein [Deltaproteobacteria bacterium]
MGEFWSNEARCHSRTIALFLMLNLAAGCASPPPLDPMKYRLADTGSGWEVAGADRVLEDLAPRYPDFFEVVLDRSHSEDPPTGDLRDDLEKQPVDRSNYDALNAIAIGYYEMNHRGELARESGDVAFISAGFRAAKLVAVPWRAYMEIEDLALRTAIVEFFEDVATGEKQDSARTMGRLAKIVESLEPKEDDLALRTRLEQLTERLFASIPPLPSAQ